MFSLPLSPCPGALSAVTRRCSCLFRGPVTLRQLRAQTSLHAQSSCPRPHRTSCFIPGSTLVVQCFPVASPRLCLSSQRQLPPHPVLLTPCPVLHSASDPARPQLSALSLNLPDLCKGHTVGPLPSKVTLPLGPAACSWACWHQPAVLSVFSEEPSSCFAFNCFHCQETPRKAPKL